MVKGKVVIITGASSGLGKTLALELGKLGVKIALLARSENLLKNVKNSIVANGGVAEYFVCDITLKDEVDNVVMKVIKNFGTVDILINNAGVWTTEELEQQKPEMTEKAFKVNSIAPIYMVKATLPIFKSRNSGHIFNVISDAGLNISDNENWLTYTATKWAMTGYTNSLKRSLSGTEIKVTGFYPGYFESNIFETAGEKNAHNQSGMMKTADVASAIIYALNQPDDLCVSFIGISNI